MKELEVVEEVEKALKFTDEDLYLYNLHKIEEVTKNEDVLELLSKVRKELEKPHSDISPDAVCLTESLNMTASFFPLDTFDYTSILYYELRVMVKRYIKDEDVKKQLLEILYLPVNYKNGQRSKFHKHSPTYDDFLNSRKLHLERIEKIKNDLQ